MTLLYLIRELVENWRNNLDVLNDVDWVIVPLLNPDGLAYLETVHMYWAKTRAVIPGSTCRGVNLNRNFDSDWMGGGSSDEVSPKMKRKFGKSLIYFFVALQRKLCRSGTHVRTRNCSRRFASKCVVP
jgi:Zinc carboxypeptidase